jgi:hypothetical protein
VAVLKATASTSRVKPAPQVSAPISTVASEDRSTAPAAVQVASPSGARPPASGTDTRVQVLPSAERSPRSGVSRRRRPSVSTRAMTGALPCQVGVLRFLPRTTSSRAALSLASMGRSEGAV